MKKIAIYGDSFAAKFDGWPKVLEDIFQKNIGDCKVTSYGISGVSVEYCYAKFLETQKQYDDIIFLWSSNNRSSLISIDKLDDDKPLEGENLTFKYHANCIANDTKIGTIKRTISIPKECEEEKHNEKFDLVDNLIAQWSALEWELFQKYPNKNIINHIAMRDSVKLKRPDTINIEVFWTMGYRSLANLPLKECHKHTNKFFILEEKENIRKNHLSLKQNVEFAEYLFEHINGKLDIHDTFEEPEKYYTFSKTLEESGFIL